MAELRALRRLVRTGLWQPPERYDPLMHPVAITEHAVIGDQIRVPSAQCEMAGCCSVFADHAALGEADNRARALVAGWAQDMLGLLACPACQPRSPVTVARAAPSAAGPFAGEQAAAGGALAAGATASSSLRAIAAQCHDALSKGRDRGSQWLALLVALAGDSNGWAVPPAVAVRARLPAPANTGGTVLREGQSRPLGRHRRWPGNTSGFAGQPGR